MSRKRRSNRLSPEQCRDTREHRLNQPTVLIGFGQEKQDWRDSAFRSVSLRVAQRMVIDGEAETFEAVTAEGTIVLFREVVAFKGMRYQLPTMPNVASAEALASYTPGARMCGRQRARVAHILAFPFIGDTRAPRVAPRVSVRDAANAQTFFRNAA